jgi:hypothetical protein
MIDRKTEGETSDSSMLKAGSGWKTSGLFRRNIDGLAGVESNLRNLLLSQKKMIETRFGETVCMRLNFKKHRVLT